MGKGLALNSSNCLRGLVAAIVLCVSVPAWAQRVQFPTQLEMPATQMAPPQLTAPPTATFQGTIQPASTWDPYADPNMQGAAQFTPAPPGYYAPPPQMAPPQITPIYPDGTTGVVPPAYPAYPGQSTTMFGGVTRLLQEIRVQDTWLIGGGGSNDLGVNSLETSATLAFPFFYNQAPLLLSPGFAAHWWDGPSSSASGSPDLPPQTYDVFLDTAWNPAITDRLSTELGFRVGAFTDFRNLGTDSLRYMFRVLGVLTYSPQTQFKLGVIYIDRNNIGFLPAGGIVYTPTQDVRYEILFPRPKLAHRITTIGNTNLWGFIAAEFGGGSWTIERADGSDDSFDYNDYRVSVGLEWLPETISGTRGLLEFGYVFERELEYESEDPRKFKPSSTFMLRAGLNY